MKDYSRESCKDLKFIKVQFIGVAIMTVFWALLAWRS